MDLSQKCLLDYCACTIKSFDVSFASNSKGNIKCASLNNQSWQAWPKFELKSTSLLSTYCHSYKCGGSCNTIDNPYARVCVPNKVNKYECKSILFNVTGL